MAAFETGFHQTIPEAERALRRARRVGRPSTASSAGAFTARAIATSPAGWPSCSAATTCKIISCHLGGSSLALCDPGGQVGGDQPGHEPADRACRTTTASATSTSSPCRSCCARPGKTLEQLLDDLANQSGLLGLSGRRRPPRHRGGGRRRATPRRRWPSTSSSPSVRHYLGAYLRRAGRGRRDRLHRRHRRELGPRSARASAATSTGSASSSTRRATPAATGERKRLGRRARACRSGSCRRTKRSSSPAKPATCLSNRQREA